MADILFVSPQDMIYASILGGNIDSDRIVFNIEDTQLSVIEPLLGSTLYNKLLIDYSANTLTGDYLTLMTEYVQPITKYESIAKYIEIAPYFLDNGGVYKRTADNKEIVVPAEVTFLSEKYHGMSQMYVSRFNRWMCNHNLPEYNTYTSDDVNAKSNMKLTGGWYFGGGACCGDNGPNNTGNIR